MTQNKILSALYNLLSGSFIITLLMRLTNYIYDSARRSVIGSLLTERSATEDYEIQAAAVSIDNLIHGEDASIPAKSPVSKTSMNTNNKNIFRIFIDIFIGTNGILTSVKRFIIRSTDSSRIIGFISGKIKSLLVFQMKWYGTFFISFGLYSAVFGIIKNYISAYDDITAAPIITGIVTAVFGMPMLFTTKNLSNTLCSSFILNKLLFRLLGIRREYLDISYTSLDESPKGRLGGAFITGMVVGLFTYFIEPALILVAIFALICAYTILMMPEIGIMLLIFAVPFMGAVPHPTIITAAAVLYVTFCFVIKLILGKRSLHFKKTDGAVLLFLILLLFGGIFSAGPSISYTLIYCCYMLGYFLAVNLIRTEGWIKRCVGSIFVSSFIVSMYGIYQNFLGTAQTIWQDTEMFSGIGGRVVSTFENPNVLAEFIIITLPFALAVFLSAKGFFGRFASFGIFSVGVACLIFTWSRGAWLGIMIGLVVFMLIYSRRTMMILLAGIAAIPFLPLVLPVSIITRFTSIGDISDSSTAYRVHIWQGSFAMLRDFWVSGIGVGKEAFRAVYPTYAFAGIESAPHSHNLYLQIGIELGLFGLIIFIAALFMTARESFTLFCRKTTPKTLKFKLYAAAGFCGIIAILAQGMTDYIWYNYRIFFIFWLMLGLINAVNRTENEKTITVPQKKT